MGASAALTSIPPQDKLALTVAYAYHLDAGRPGVQSGRPYAILSELRGLGVRIEELFPLDDSAYLARMTLKVANRLIGRGFLLDRHEGLLHGFAAQIQNRLGSLRPDAIFSPSTLPLAHLETEIPTCFCADAPFSAMRDYYPSFSRLNGSQVELSERLEKRVLDRCTMAVYPSRWAAESAIASYGVDPAKVVVIPFGANRGRENQRAAVEDWIAQRTLDELRLLFVGEDWKRKGGPIVLETVDRLQRRGLKVRLDIVGSEPCASGGGIHVHGRLSANVAEDAQKLTGLFQKAHFFVLPSRAEAYGMALCEANAFGLPAISTDTGGISEIIRNGVNGYKLPHDAEAADYENVILECSADLDTYRRIALSAFAEFESRLNWKTHCERFVSMLRDRLPALVPDHGSSPRAGGDASRPAPEIQPAVFNTQSAATVGRSGAAQTSNSPWKMRIGFATTTDPDDRFAWSGINYTIRKELEAQGATVVPIGPLRTPWTSWKRAQSYLSRLVFRKQYTWNVDPLLLGSHARQVQAALRANPCDILFSPGTHPIAHLQTEIPMAFWTDAPFEAMIGYYPWYSELSETSRRLGFDCDDRAIRNSALVCYSSRWAADTAIARHRADPSKVHVIPFGSNLPSKVTAGEIPQIVASRLAKPWRLLFVGVEWERKGGDVVFETARLLNERGHPTELFIVGCKVPPKYHPLPAWAHAAGFISQHSPEGQKRLSELFRSSLFFCMPSVAEAYGIVFCEANNHALPCLATKTGGIPSIIEEGINGRLFAPGTAAIEFASFIEQSAGNPERYAAMAAESLRTAHERLNWTASVRQLLTLLENTTVSHRTRS